MRSPPNPVRRVERITSMATKKSSQSSAKPAKTKVMDKKSMRGTKGGVTSNLLKKQQDTSSAVIGNMG